MHRRSVAVFDRFLSALATILDKADTYCAAKKIKPEVILAAMRGAGLDEVRSSVQYSILRAYVGCRA